ncbi:MAG: hypothetical protein ACPHIC_11040, partial [Acidimicrobiales bacterium]
MGSAWRTTATLGLFMVGVAAFAGEGAQSAARALAALLLILTVAHQARTRPHLVATPWVLIATGGGLALVSALARLAHGLVIDESSPFPSYAEVPGYLGYVFVIASARSFWNHRSSRRDPAAALDGVLVATAAAVVVFTAVLSDYLRDDTFSTAHRLGNVGYSLLTLTLLG